jgi:8-oxo-dGTP pyrophosphatase MutT (NUDIX family)
MDSESTGKSPAIWQRQQRDLHADCRIYKVWKDHCIHPDGRQGDFFSIDAPDWVLVLAFTEKQEILVVRQFRFGLGELTWEIPAGVMEKGESAETAAARELLEETGYGGGSFRCFGTLRPNPALQSNRVFLVAAEGVHRISGQQPDSHEELQVEALTIGEFEQKIASEEMDHAIVVAAWARWKFVTS